MSSITYLKTTKHLLANLFSVFKPMPSIDAQIPILEGIDASGKLYVENVRALFGISNDVAERLCEQAVKDGLFEKRWAVLCRNSECRRVVHETIDLRALPEEVCCELCGDMDAEVSAFKTTELDRLPFYVWKAYGK